MLKPRNRTRLQLKTLNELRIQRRMGRQNLDGDLTVDIALVAEIDRRHAPLANGVQNFVLGDGTPNQR
jgi:hypothetical protein